MRIRERRRGKVGAVCLLMVLCAAAFRLAGEIWERVPERIPEQPAAFGTCLEKVQGPLFPTRTYTRPEVRKAPAFSPAEADRVPVINWSGTEADCGALISRPLDFPLSGEPQILVVHTHATEAYCDMEDYRSRDGEHSVVRVGEVLTEELNARGIPTLHDGTFIDCIEGYDDPYVPAAEVIEEYLARYPSIQMVIDVHRDGAVDEEGNQIPLLCDIGGEQAAKLLLVMGTDRSGLYHPRWEDNLSFALKLQALCSRDCPGLFRSLCLRASRFNQHLTPHSILLEVGAAGNSMEEALTSVRFFAGELAKLLGK